MDTGLLASIAEHGVIRTPEALQKWLQADDGHELLPRRATDERGRLLPLSPEQLRARQAAALRALDEVEKIGDEAEHRETLDYLMKALHREPLVSDPRGL